MPSMEINEAGEYLQQLQPRDPENPLIFDRTRVYLEIKFSGHSSVEFSRCAETASVDVYSLDVNWHRYPQRPSRTPLFSVQGPIVSVASVIKKVISTIPDGARNA